MAASLLLFTRTADFGSPQLFQTRKRGSPTAFQSYEDKSRKPGFGWGVDRLAHQATATARTPQNASAVAGLARFFPESTPVRIAVQLARTQPGEVSATANFTESTIIEFGTPREVLFACHTPLE